VTLYYEELCCARSVKSGFERRAICRIFAQAVGRLRDALGVNVKLRRRLRNARLTRAKRPSEKGGAGEGGAGAGGDAWIPSIELSASVSVDPTVAPGRERNKGNSDEARKQKFQQPAQVAVTEDPESNDALSAEEEKTKGKNIDINI
jgi:hypothetical protein